MVWERELNWMEMAQHSVFDVAIAYALKNSQSFLKMLLSFSLVFLLLSMLAQKYIHERTEMIAHKS